ncbi:MAG: polyribonucleotide nucleotidyltransferase [Verrucomicrobia bacterium]|nr:polyribonucleotide nucleotidyltransferase [Verrucomicrobiota bacterium]
MLHKVIAPAGSSQITIQTGIWARQASGSVTVQQGETIVLVAAVAASKPKEGLDFFPLTVDYREKAAAAGKFPGGYFKREGRPTEKEILTSRFIDRPLRPQFPDGWLNETQIQCIVISADGEHDPDVLAVLGASAALSISDIPWGGPLGALRLGRINGQFVINPTHSQIEESDLDLIYVGDENNVVMFEGSADEISEDDFSAAMQFAQAAIQPMIAAQRELVKAAGKIKRTFEAMVIPPEVTAAAKEIVGDRMMPALTVVGKLEREAAVNAIKTEMTEKLVEKFGEELITSVLVGEVFYEIQSSTVRSLLLDKGQRMDGRAMDEVRPITMDVGILPRSHGSSIFTRGETQALSMATLGAMEDAQEFDSYTGGSNQKQFILHYNFPNFSVGETGRISGPGRREIGHGALAERSIEPMIPLKDYPYAIRVSTEILESNGSSSMATVCAGTLSLMDAGIPLIRPVAGISAGLCTEYDENGALKRHVIMTDIMGWEDAFGDMDCKIAGTEKGITGFQLDLKLKGVPLSIIAEALQKTRAARLKILKLMSECIAAPRSEISKYAPRIVSLKIPEDKIGALIGPGGKNIKALCDESGCEINIEDDGTVRIYGSNKEGMDIARTAVEALSAEIKVGEVYRGKVVSIKDFGCFVEVLPGKEGLVHISELANFRVKQVEDIVRVGDSFPVKCIGVDDKGRVRLSRKAALAERDREMKDGKNTEEE